MSASSAVTTAGYLARRAAQKQRVRIPYRRALKDTLNWAVQRHLFYQDASDLWERFDANKHVEDLDAIDRMIADAEATISGGTLILTLFLGLLVVPSLAGIQCHLQGSR